MPITFDLRKIYNYSFWKCELKPSEHACKIFFNYLKLCVVSLLAKKVHYLPPKHFSNEFSYHYWQKSFDGDSFASQSRFDAYADSNTKPSIVYVTEQSLCHPISVHSQSYIASFPIKKVAVRGASGRRMKDGVRRRGPRKIFDHVLFTLRKRPF